MIYIYYVCLFLAMLIGFSACKKEANLSPTDLGIQPTDTIRANNAEGNLNQQNAGPKRTLVIDAAYVKPLNSRQYRVMLKFQSKDSLQFIIAKATQDFNYHFPKLAAKNELLFAIYNRVTPALKERAISIQPRPEENTFHTITNIHTLGMGDFNGTVNRVPLIELNSVVRILLSTVSCHTA